MMRESLWAKSASPGAAQGETLRQHTQYVLEVLGKIARLWPDLPDRLGCPRFWHICFWACVLHDFGKAASGFQQQVRPGGSPWGRRHEVLSLAFLGWLQTTVTPDELPWLSAAIASHHKDISAISQRYPLDEDPEDDVLYSMIGEITPEAFAELRDILTVRAPEWLRHYGFESLEVQDLQEGSAAYPDANRDTIARHLRSFQRMYRKLSQADARHAECLIALALRGIVINADHQASAHAFAVRPTPLRGGTDILFRIERTWEGLHPHQREAAHAKGSTLLTAPTGSGKTEAALLWAANQGDEAKQPPRLLYVLPFQASMNAMYRRLSRSFPKDVGLQHGRSLHALYAEVLDAEPDPKHAEAIARREKNLADLHQHPIRVLSPYQILKACYRLRGYEAILTDLHGALFILDEIHAYEPRRLALILGLLSHLKHYFGARYFAMSATLPTLVHDVLRQALGIEQTITASPQIYEQYRRHTVHLAEGDLLVDGPALIDEAMRQGLSVLVCCNTVQRAQAMWAQLRDAHEGDAIIELLHGRFNTRDRLDKEQRILAHMAAGARQAQQVVLVATQVVEVSLNIDFDLLFTEPAPLEALLQRFGRVNRLGRRHLAPVHVFSRPDDGQQVYEAALVRATLAVLRDVSGKPVDESQIGSWLDRIYAGDIAAEWLEMYKRQATEFEATCLANLHPFQSNDELEELFYQAFDAVEVLPLSLQAEYDRLRAERPLEADSLLASIRANRYFWLKRHNRLCSPPGQWPIIVDVPYSSETGLNMQIKED